jgi:predicted RNA-binding Zn ribbon-like protein
MSGERVVCEGPQPGGRPPAPGALALVQAFINSHYDLERDHGAELLHSPQALQRWLSRYGLLGADAPADADSLSRALELREGLRARARDGIGDPPRLDGAASGAAVRVRVAGDGQLRFEPAAGSGVAGALGVVLANVAIAVADGSWSRLKICPGDACGWAFYDGSRNRSGRWCSMSVCGGRAKARAHYRRHRSSETAM